MLVRHCLTDFDVADSSGRFCGRSDPPLNAKGVAEAQCLRNALSGVRFDRAYSGGSKRCEQTLDILLEARETPRLVDARLAEIDYGQWDGLAKGEIASRYATEWIAFEKDPASTTPKGGEPAPRCAERSMAWVSACTDQRVLAVVDKTWLRLLLCSLMGVPLRDYRRCIDIKVGGVTALLWSRDHWRIEAVNYLATVKRIAGAA